MRAAFYQGARRFNVGDTARAQAGSRARVQHDDRQGMEEALAGGPVMKVLIAP